MTGRGFTGIEKFSFDEPVPHTPQARTGRIRASAGVAASLPADQVTVLTTEPTEILRRDFSGEVLHIPHRTWAVTATKPFTERQEQL